MGQRHSKVSSSATPNPRTARRQSTGPRSRSTLTDFISQVAHHVQQLLRHRGHRTASKATASSRSESFEMQTIKEAQLCQDDMVRLEEAFEAHHILEEVQEAEEAEEQVIGEVTQLSEHITVSQKALDLDGYPILSHLPTIQWIGRDRVMVIMRGLPGSGKSTLVEAVVKLYNLMDGVSPVVCSADHFFVESGGGGQYHFDRALLKKAHAACQDAATQAVSSGSRLIIVDNTNVQRWEMAYYFQLAHRHSYLIIVLEPNTPWKLDVDALAAKNSHGVPKEVLSQRIREFGPILPVYYAWFLSLEDSEALLEAGRKWLQKCLESCADFGKDFRDFSRLPSWKSTMSYYNRDECSVSSQKRLHCTAKFVCKKRGGAPDVYAQSEAVLRSLGQSQRLQVIGWIFTQDTFGARVRLSDSQLALFQAEQSADPDTEEPCAPVERPASWHLEEQDHDRELFVPISGPGARAHITLGTAPGVKPVTTGKDLMRVVSMEKRWFDGQLSQRVRTYRLADSSAKLRSYSQGCWVLYPEQILDYEALFSGHF